MGRGGGGGGSQRETESLFLFLFLMRLSKRLPKSALRGWLLTRMFEALYKLEIIISHHSYRTLAQANFRNDCSFSNLSILSRLLPLLHLTHLLTKAKVERVKGQNQMVRVALKIASQLYARHCSLTLTSVYQRNPARGRWCKVCSCRDFRVKSSKACLLKVASVSTYHCPAAEKYR